MTDYKKFGYDLEDLTREYPTAEDIPQDEERKTLDLYLPKLKLLTTDDIAPFDIVDRVQQWVGNLPNIDIINERENFKNLNNSYYVRERDGNAFCLIHPGNENYDFSNGVNIIVAHLDNPNLRIRPQPTYFEWDPEKKNQHPGPYLEALPNGGINAGDWVNKNGYLHGRFYIGNEERRVHLLARVPHTSIHLEIDEQEDNSFNRVRVFTGATEVLGLYKQLGIQSELQLAGAELFFYPETKFTMLTDDYITAYGLDDRLCVTASVLAFMESNPQIPTFVFGLDNEEIGSTGPAGRVDGFFSNVVSKYVTQRLKKDRLMTLEELYSENVLGTIPAICADVGPIPGFNEDAMYHVTFNESAKYGFGPFICPSWGGFGDSNSISGRYTEYVRSLLEQNIRDKYQIVGSDFKSGDTQIYGVSHFAQYFSNRQVPMVAMGIPVGDLHRPGGEMAFTWDFYWGKKAYEAYINKPANL